MAVGEVSMLQQSLLTVAILLQCCGVQSLCSHSEGESFEVSQTVYCDAAYVLGSQIPLVVGKRLVSSVQFFFLFFFLLPTPFLS